MRPSLDQWAMDVAQATAKRGTCLRRQVGCVLLDREKRVVATGYNGVAAGLPHCNDPVVVPGRLPVTVINGRPYNHACAGASAPSGQGLDLCEAIHAEQNALLRCGDVTKLWSCYTTASPCVTCVKLLMSTPCWRVVFLEEYPHTQAREYWLAAGREWVKL